MMCQRIGNPPTSIMGLGFTSVSSARRLPRPPARMTTFIDVGYQYELNFSRLAGTKTPRRTRAREQPWKEKRRFRKVTCCVPNDLARGDRARLADAGAAGK